MVLWSILEKNSRIQTDKKSTTYIGDYTWFFEMGDVYQIELFKSNVQQYKL